MYLPIPLKPSQFQMPIKRQQNQLNKSINGNIQGILKKELDSNFVSYREYRNRSNQSHHNELIPNVQRSP